MLRVILNIPDLTVLSVQTQRTFRGFGRSVCLDVYAEDSGGTRYNIEIQQASEGADPRRARFNGAMVDVHSLDAGQDFRELPECYVIFITLRDVLKGGRMIYTIHRYVDNGFQPFDDGSHIIYVNASAEDDGSELGKLIHDLKCEDPDEMFFPRLASRVRFLKEDEEGVAAVSNYFERLREKALKEEKESIAMKLLRLGKVTLEEIAECSGLTLHRVRALARAM